MPTLAMPPAMAVHKTSCRPTSRACAIKLASAARLSNLSNTASRSRRDDIPQRDLLLDILNANATRRDAKQYLAHFKSQVGKAPTSHSCIRVDAPGNAFLPTIGHAGVNLGYLYESARAIEDSPTFLSTSTLAQSHLTEHLPLRVTMVLLRESTCLDDATMDGLSLTFAQLTKLGMKLILVVEACANNGDPSAPSRMDTISEQATRFARAYMKHGAPSPRFVSDALDVNDDGVISLLSPRLITEPLRNGTIAVLPNSARDHAGLMQFVSAGSLMVALTDELLPFATCAEMRDMMSLDRVIVLDQLGGIPSRARGNDSHVFINLEQEYQHIKHELQESAKAMPEQSEAYHRHQENIDMLNDCLFKMSSSSSAMIISPREAAMSAQVGQMQPAVIQTGTRRQKNTLIHNLLTNKPTVSSSLPSGRLPSMSVDAQTATLVKRGMRLSMIPDPGRSFGWVRPPAGQNTLNLEHDPRIDFDRLQHLIEDSFRRELDVQHYLGRIRGRVAGIIIAGDYEGGAVLTWEQPPGTKAASRMVPYLDKFAVLQSSQGSAGVADILFQAMVRSCFPHGVCWRSRNDNPVNRWYFERAAGSWQIPGSKWTMFWTGDDVTASTTRFDDYVNTCRHILPSFK